MIKTALKHFIYELCIEKIFDSVARNFSPNVKRYVKGERYERLVTYSRGTHVYYNITIIDCDTHTIKFSYVSAASYYPKKRTYCVNISRSDIKEDVMFEGELCDSIMHLDTTLKYSQLVIPITNFRFEK